MLRTTTYILILTAFGWTACKSTQHVSTDTIVTEKTQNKTLDGYWILTNYLDSIFKDKSISKHRLYPITWCAMTLHIKEDTLYSNGLLYVKEIIKIHSDNDTVGLIDSYGKFILRYNPKNDCIEATDISTDNHSEYIGKNFIYRRVTEKRLLEIFEQKDRLEIETGFYQLFIDRLIAGEYKSIENGKTLTLTSDGLMKGGFKLLMQKLVLQ